MVIFSITNTHLKTMSYFFQKPKTTSHDNIQQCHYPHGLRFVLCLCRMFEKY